MKTIKKEYRIQNAKKINAKQKEFNLNVNEYKMQ